MWALLLVLAACSDDAPAPGDGGGLDAGTLDASHVPASPASPALPALPSLTPCPTGWSEVAPDGPGRPATCDPWPASGRAESCPLGEAHFPGEPGCALIGSACPAGEFADGLPASGVVYVRAGASGGDGSPSAPFGRIADAIDVAVAGTTIALSRGTFDEAVMLPAGVVLRGACVAETTLAESTRTADVVVLVTGPEAEIRDVRVAGARGGIGSFTDGAHFTIEGVLIEDLRPAPGVEGRGGIGAVLGSSASIRSVVVRDVSPGDDGSLGFGINFGPGGGDMSRVIVERVYFVGTVTVGPLTIEDTAILDVTDGPGGMDAGEGLHVEAATVAASRVVIERVLRVGVSVGVAGADVALTDVVVRDIAESAEGSLGRAMDVSLGARLTASHVLLERAKELAVSVDASTIEASDLIVRETQGLGDGSVGFGLVAQNTSTVALSRTLFDRNRRLAIHIRTTSAATLTDTTVLDTLSELASGRFGHALEVSGGARVDGERLLAERSVNAAVLAAESAQIDMADVTIRDVVPDATPIEMTTSGVALAVVGGGEPPASLRIQRLIAERSAQISVFADREGGLVALEDATIMETAPRADGSLGRAVSVQGGARVELRRGILAGAHEYGVAAIDRGSAHLEDVVVRDTHARTCPSDPCSATGAGMGVSSVANGSVDLIRFVVTSNALAGLQIGPGGVMTARGGEVSNNPVGANIQATGFDVAAINQDVIYRDNGMNLDSAELVVPQPGAPVGR